MPQPNEAVVTVHDFEKLEKRLYGNGQPGDIETIKRKHEALEKRVDRAIWIGFLVVIVTGMATGNGLASFEHLWKLIFP